jgi:hypothetical protein
MSGAAPGAGPDIDDFFRREFLRSLLELAVQRLEADLTRNGKAVHFRLFRRYDIDLPSMCAELTYADLAAEFGLPETQVTNFLALARRRFRQHVLESLRELTASDREFAAEARELLGIVVV